MKGNQHQHVMFSKHKFLFFFPTVSVLVVTAIVSGVLSATTAAIVASVIMWCVMKKRSQSKSDRGMQDTKSGAHELTSVVYDVPVLKDHQNQTISTQDNVAYGGTIPLQQNVAYEQHNYD